MKDSKKPEKSWAHLEDQNIVLLGSDGRLGQAFMDRFSEYGLQGVAFDDPALGKNKVRETLKQNPNTIFVVAVSAQYQVAVHETIFSEIRSAQEAGETPQLTIINLNSVQDQVTKTLEYRMNDIPENTTLVGLHPHHGHPMTTNPDLDKKWVLTYSKRADRIQEKERAATRLLKIKLKGFFTKAGINDFELFNFDEAAKNLPQFRNGADLHDTLTAYSQALVHMLRILVDNDEIFFEEFVQLQVGRDLSEAIVNQNPYAREGIFEKIIERIPPKTDPEFITKLKLIALDFVQEYESRYSDIPQNIRDAAKTPKFEELKQRLATDCLAQQ